jgi:hypothetical protein
LEHVKQNVRLQICADCPQRTPGTDASGPDIARPCEAECPIFHALPHMTETARQMDPLVGHPTRALARILLNISRAGARSTTAIAQHGRKVIKLLENMFHS